MRLFERALSVLFPIRNYKIKSADEAKTWFQYESSNHPQIDPFRPLGKYDSWAGNIKEHAVKKVTVRQKRWQPTI